jgi:hypothetical protein
MQLLSDNTALRAHFESQADFMHEFSQKAFDTLRQVSEMNLKLARQEIEGALYASREIMGCSDPMQMVQAAMRQIPPAAERLRSYQQHLMSVLSGGQAGLSGAFQARLPAATRSAGEVADEVLQRAAASAPLAAATGPAIGIGNGNGSGNAAGETHH